MNWICEECGYEIEDQTSECPCCGEPVSREKEIDWKAAFSKEKKYKEKITYKKEIYEEIHKEEMKYKAEEIRTKEEIIKKEEAKEGTEKKEDREEIKRKEVKEEAERKEEEVKRKVGIKKKKRRAAYILFAFRFIHVFSIVSLTATVSIIIGLFAGFVFDIELPEIFFFQAEENLNQFFFLKQYNISNITIIQSFPDRFFAYLPSLFYNIILIFVQQYDRYAANLYIWIFSIRTFWSEEITSVLFMIRQIF